MFSFVFSWFFFRDFCVFVIFFACLFFSSIDKKCWSSLSSFRWVRLLLVLWSGLAVPSSSFWWWCLLPPPLDSVASPPLFLWSGLLWRVHFPIILWCSASPLRWCCFLVSPFGWSSSSLLLLWGIAVSLIWGCLTVVSSSFCCAVSSSSSSLEWDCRSCF